MLYVDRAMRKGLKNIGKIPLTDDGLMAAHTHCGVGPPEQALVQAVERVDIGGRYRASQPCGERPEMVTTTSSKQRCCKPRRSYQT